MYFTVFEYRSLKTGRYMVVGKRSEVWMNGTGSFLPRVQGPKCGVQFACRTNTLGFSMTTSLAAIDSKCNGGGLLTKLYLSEYLSSHKRRP